MICCDSIKVLSVSVGFPAVFKRRLIELQGENDSRFGKAILVSEGTWRIKEEDKIQ